MGASQDSLVMYMATVFFALAIIHTFFCHKLLPLAHRYPPGSLRERVWHFLAEVEVVFGLWAFALMLVVMGLRGLDAGAAVIMDSSFTEAAFVFVIMCVAATRPIMELAAYLMNLPSRFTPAWPRVTRYLTYLTLGPLLGSFITEPAAMTVTALLLKNNIFDDHRLSTRFKYATLGLLFVNVSIGGTLSHMAAPPVVMVSGVWGWDLWYMLSQFGWKAALAVILGTSVTALVFRRELKEQGPRAETAATGVPAWVSLVHVLFMLLIVLYHTSMAFFLPLFCVFIAWAEITKSYQSPLKIRESLLVGCFLGGLVILGRFQAWWLQPLISQLGDTTLYLSAISLTALTDNAALTYLGSLVPSLSDSAKYYLVAGAVTGGGLTLIANAPNPAGYGILRDSFGEDGIKPLGLLLGALPFTILAGLFFYFL